MGGTGRRPPALSWHFLEAELWGLVTPPAGIGALKKKASPIPVYPRRPPGGPVEGPNTNTVYAKLERSIRRGNANDFLV